MFYNFCFSDNFSENPESNFHVVCMICKMIKVNILTFKIVASQNF